MLLRGLEAIGQFGQCRAAVSSFTSNSPTATRNLENWARGLSTCQAWLTSVTVKNTSWNARIAVHWRKLRLQCLLRSRFLRIGVSKSKSAGEKSRGQSFAIFCHFLATDDKAEKKILHILSRVPKFWSKRSFDSERREPRLCVEIVLLWNQFLKSINANIIRGDAPRWGISNNGARNVTSEPSMRLHQM